MNWAATQAKAKFSEVLDRAETEGPQLVRRRKREFILLTREAHESRSLGKPTQPAKNAWEALRPSSGATFDLELPTRSTKRRSVKF